MFIFLGPLNPRMLVSYEIVAAIWSSSDYLYYRSLFFTYLRPKSFPKKLTLITAVKYLKSG